MKATDGLHTRIDEGYLNGWYRAYWATNGEQLARASRIRSGGPPSRDISPRSTLIGIRTSPSTSAYRVRSTLCTRPVENGAMTRAGPGSAPRAVLGELAIGRPAGQGRRWS